MSKISNEGILNVLTGICVPNKPGSGVSIPEFTESLH